jgi:autotransporter-associated beta strand protein
VTVGFTNNATATSNNNILTVGTGAVVSNIAALTLGSGAGTETGNELLLLGGGSLTATSITVSAGNTLRFGTGGTTSALSLTGDITNNGSMVFNLSDTITQGTNFDSAFGGSGSVSQNGSGDLILTGTNTYNGGTNINAGTLSFANGSLGTTGNITFAGNSSLRWHGSNIQNVSSRIVMSNGVTSSFHTNGNDVNFASAIGSSTSGSLTKAGAGKLTLNGVNSYTGATSVSAGTLEIASGGSTHASSGVSVTGTANLIVNGTVNGTVTTAAGTTLSGTGTIAGNATISGIHNPGNSPGIQTFGGNLTYEGGSSVVNWELTGNTTTNVANPNAVFDQMLITGELNFAATTSVNLVFNGAGSTVDWTNSLWNSSQSWLIYDVDTVNNFVNLDLNETNWLDSTGAFFETVRPGGTFSFSQVSNGINLNYTVVPESSTALLGAFGALALLRRRRK